MRCFPLLLVCACSSSDPIDVDGDNPVGSLSLEGQEVADLLGPDSVSEALQTDSGFRRLGLLWDATAEHVLQVRTSVDGATWTEWTEPTLVSLEEIAHAGHVDAFDLGVDGSLDSDPLAHFYQLRVTDASPLPTFLVVQPLVDIPSTREPAYTAILEEAEPDEIESVVRSTPIGSIRIYSRADWGARPPRCASGSMIPNRATIHHTVTPINDSMTVPQRLRQIQAFHMFTNGWCDIGYNYLVSRDGRVWRGRGARTIGAHVENNNTGNVGISFIGTYTSTAPTATQMCNAAKLLRRLHEDFSGISLNRTDVKGHRQYASTACPGTALYNRIDTIVSKARNGC
jgi:hypothetical protein